MISRLSGKHDNAVIETMWPSPGRQTIRIDSDYSVKRLSNGTLVYQFGTIKTAEDDKTETIKTSANIIYRIIY